ncbi:hypothetical protein HJG60_011046 [Phyllostomus discolor]|uniref:Uncharacterized protein n=1 Tax=Phyllostomus discolor TaxID=89673 RepID=A0A834E6Q4_9CHIR|nr:hypothetical protein HJG60_011046 [Phyllostomus discolor]
MVPFLKEPTGTQAIPTRGCTGAGEVRRPGNAGGAPAQLGARRILESFQLQKKPVFQLRPEEEWELVEGRGGEGDRRGGEGNVLPSLECSRCCRRLGPAALGEVRRVRRDRWAEPAGLIWRVRQWRRPSPLS